MPNLTSIRDQALLASEMLDDGERNRALEGEVELLEPAYGRGELDTVVAVVAVVWALRVLLWGR